MSFVPRDQFNIADYFLSARITEGRGDRVALITDRERLTYRDVDRLANQYGNLLRDIGVEPEQRVIVALDDGPAYVGALFGALKIGAVVVMVNPHLREGEVPYFYEYTRAKVAVVGGDGREAFQRAVREATHRPTLLFPEDPATAKRLDAASGDLAIFPSHKDDAAIWLFSGGTTGKPKAVVQTHTSFANTTECYAKQVIRYSEDDITISVPKLFFGYATGSNLFFPFAAGAASVLFPERCTAEVLFEKIETYHPTILINVPTMVNQMVSHPSAGSHNLSSLRLTTSAGEALPVELHNRWDGTFGVELLDGLGTAEMWHIFISNRPGDVRPGTLGTVVPGFEVRVCDHDGHDLPDGEVGMLWVKGNSRAIGYWQQLDKTQAQFRGEWYVSGDLVKRDADGYFTYCGRADDLLKVKGKWLAPQEVESCLLEHPRVQEVAVVGVRDDDGLTNPYAFVVCKGETAELAEKLLAFAGERLASYKQPKQIFAIEKLPRTHLGKVNRRELQERVRRA